MKNNNVLFSAPAEPAENIDDAYRLKEEVMDDEHTSKCPALVSETVTALGGKTARTPLKLLKCNGFT